MSFVNLYSSANHVVPLFIAFNDTIPNSKYNTKLQNQIDMTYMHCTKQLEETDFRRCLVGVGWKRYFINADLTPRDAEIDTVENIIYPSLRRIFRGTIAQHLETIEKSFRAIEQYQTNNINNNNTKDNYLLKDLYHQYIDTDHYFNKNIVTCDGNKC
eukprot:Pgem_evm1s9378